MQKRFESMPQQATAKTTPANMISLMKFVQPIAMQANVKTVYLSHVWMKTANAARCLTVVPNNWIVGHAQKTSSVVEKASVKNVRQYHAMELAAHQIKSVTTMSAALLLVRDCAMEQAMVAGAVAILNVPPESGATIKNVSLVRL
jgi:hypothetical protein